MRPVYLHGRGLVSALGVSQARAVANLSQPDTHKKISRMALPGGSDWPYFAIEQGFAGQGWRDRARQLIVMACAEAALEACKDAPLFVASSSVDIGAMEAGEPKLQDFFAFPELITSWLAWRGPLYPVSSACTSSLQAMLAASQLIASGVTDDAVVLGVELSNRFSVSGFAAMQLLTPNSPKPLGLGRDGIALGEAVAVLHLSSRPVRWRVRGGSNLVDGRDPTGAIPQTVTQMCKRALAASGLKAQDIGLIKLQAAGSPANDVNELHGLAGAFETLPALVSLKAQIGHTLGASGAAEIALLLSCLEAGVWPAPDYPADPELHAELARKAPASVRYILADILGFGGGHAAVILEDGDVKGVMEK